MITRLFRSTPKTPITRYKIFGERCSGTTYLHSLMKANFPELNHTQKHFGWKHTFYQNDVMHNSDNCLFLIIFRNPYKWLGSLYNKPWHVPEEIKSLSFSDFIRHEWWSVYDKHSKLTDKNMHLLGTELMMERNPDNGARFENILKLRSRKIQHLVELGDKVQHIKYVRHEDISNDPERFIRELKLNYRLPENQSFTPVDTYKGKGNKPYIAKAYIDISDSDKQFILSQLDLKLEEKIGYQLG